MNIKQIVLHNFLSHKDTTLDLSVDGVYNIVGPTGAGKSSIRDAITWCLFGKSRVEGAGDELIRNGESEMFVSLYVEINGKVFFILRQREKDTATKLSVEEVK